MIPKIIHYCWFGKGNLPSTFEECYNSWEKYCPDYKIIKWDESNSPMDIHWIKAAYKSKKFAFVADYMRFYALYKLGGIYLDTDMLLIKNIDIFLKNKLFAGLEDKDTVSMGIIGAEPNNNFIKECLNFYHQNEFDFMNPPIITRMVTSKLVQEGFSGIDETKMLKNGCVIYKSDYFYPIHYTQKFLKDEISSYVKENTFSIHLWNNSWMSEFQLILNKRYRDAYKIAFNRICSNPFLPLRYYYRLFKYTFRIIIGKY